MGNSVMREYATPFTALHAVSLLSHKSRLQKFNRAIRKVVKEEDYVVDIGTGTGVLAMMASRAGARRVTAIDINGESLKYARLATKVNGLDGGIEFKQGHFKEFFPKEKADVVICEMLSSMMLIEQQVPAAAHANAEILKPDGLMLPSAVDVYVVPVECPSIWNRFSVASFEFPRMPQTSSKEQTRD
ncbi:methyltransferase domain-containing protein, partial [Candidatus Thorarchaeota archaeon]